MEDLLINFPHANVTSIMENLFFNSGVHLLILLTLPSLNCSPLGVLFFQGNFLQLWNAVVISFFLRYPILPVSYLLFWGRLPSGFLSGLPLFEAVVGPVLGKLLENVTQLLLTDITYLLLIEKVTTYNS